MATPHRNKTHGKSGTRIYRTYHNMIDRCTNCENKEYHNYGGRGIGVCQRWLERFENFLADVGEPPTQRHSLDRINNDGDYEPDNIRWATPKQQAINSRRSILIEHNGIVDSVAGWCKRIGIDRSSVTSRLERGFSISDAIFHPRVKRDKTFSRRSRIITHDGITDSEAGWARRLGMSRTTFQHRLHEWKDVHRAITEVVRPY